MKLRVLVAAEREVAAAYAYYESQSEGLGRRMTAEIRVALAGILDFPEAHPMLPPVHRKRNLKKFPYGIIYRIEGDEVILVACFHLRSDPTRWRELLKTR